MSSPRAGARCPCISTTLPLLLLMAAGARSFCTVTLPKRLRSSSGAVSGI